MRHAVLLFGAIVIFALNVHGQVNPSYSLMEPPAQASTINPSGTAMFALATLPAVSAPTWLPDPLAESAARTQQTSPVYGVFPDYYWRIYTGYSFFRFYIASKPSVTKNTNGLDLGVVYYPHVGWIGIEGQFAGEYGGLYGQSLKFGLGVGGVRFRWSAPREAELWGHVLVGGSQFIPQTAFGGQSAFAYELGGGVDLGSHRKRFAIRAEADLVGTRYFSTYQYSPRVAGGVVFKY
jgi:hypothetical protein